MKFKTFYFFKPKFDKKLKYSHAQLPTAINLKNFIRVFYAMRDKYQRSNIFYSDFKIDKNFRVKKIFTSKKPILTIGKEGSCDCDGVIPSSIIKIGKKYFLYFVGWNKGKEKPLFYSSISLAVSKDCKNFKKLFNAPVLQRNHKDPYLVTSPNVNKYKKFFYMYYTSGLNWNKIKGEYQSKYNIKIAKSKDKINWITNNKFILKFKKKERNIGHPFFFEIKKKKYLFYSYGRINKKNLNEIGFAIWDKKNLCWVRKDKSLNIEKTEKYSKLSKSYPYLLKYKKEILLFFNGDNFGKKGFCIAVLTHEK